MNEIAGRVISTPLPAEQVLVAIKELTNAVREYGITKETEVTKRQHIAALRDYQLSSLEKQKQLVETYLREIFKERSGLFDEAFLRLDAALVELKKRPEDTSQLKAMDVCLSIIVGQIKQSPLEGLSSIIQTMENGDGIIEI